MAGIKFNGAEVFKSSLQKPESYLVSSVGRVSHSRTLGKYFLLKKLVWDLRILIGCFKSSHVTLCQPSEKSYSRVVLITLTTLFDLNFCPRRVILAKWVH